MTERWVQKRGRDLKPGDTIEVWWSFGKSHPDKRNRDTIESISPYRGKLTLWSGGACIVVFGRLSMTIGNDEPVCVLVQGEEDGIVKDGTGGAGQIQPNIPGAHRDQPG